MLRPRHLLLLHKKLPHWTVPSGRDPLARAFPPDSGKGCPPGDKRLGSRQHGLRGDTGPNRQELGLVLGPREPHSPHCHTQKQTITSTRLEPRQVTLRPVAVQMELGKGSPPRHEASGHLTGPGTRRRMEPNDRWKPTWIGGLGSKSLCSREHKEQLRGPPPAPPSALASCHSCPCPHDSWGIVGPDSIPNSQFVKFGFIRERSQPPASPCLMTSV